MIKTIIFDNVELDLENWKPELRKLLNLLELYREEGFEVDVWDTEVMIEEYFSAVIVFKSLKLRRRRRR